MCRHSFGSIAVSQGSSSLESVSAKLDSCSPSSLSRPVLSLRCLSAQRPDCPELWPFAPSLCCFPSHPLREAAPDAQESAPSQLLRSLNGAFITGSSRCGSQKHRLDFCIAPHDLTLSSLYKAPSTGGCFSSAVMSLKITTAIALQRTHGGHSDVCGEGLSQPRSIPTMLRVQQNAAPRARLVGTTSFPPQTRDTRQPIPPSSCSTQTAAVSRAQGRSTAVSWTARRDAKSR